MPLPWPSPAGSSLRFNQDKFQLLPTCDSAGPKGFRRGLWTRASQDTMSALGTAGQVLGHCSEETLPPPTLQIAGRFGPTATPTFGKERWRTTKCQTKKVRQGEFQFNCFCVDPAGLAQQSPALRFCCLSLLFSVYFQLWQCNIQNESLRQIRSAVQDHTTFRLDYSVVFMKLALGTPKTSACTENRGWDQNIHPWHRLIPCIDNPQNPACLLSPKIYSWTGEKRQEVLSSATGRFPKIWNHNANAVSFRPWHKPLSLMIQLFSNQMETGILMA